MPIRKIVKKSQDPADNNTTRTGEFSLNFSLPQEYRPIQVPTQTPAPYAIAGLPTSSTRDLNYFFTLAGSLYRETVGNERHASSSTAPDAPPSYNDDFQDTSMDFAAVLVIWLFRQTATHVFPITERFHCTHTFPLLNVPLLAAAKFLNQVILTPGLSSGTRRPPAALLCHRAAEYPIRPRVQRASYQKTRSGQGGKLSMPLEFLGIHLRI
jgi:hypothetical protein